MVCRSPMGVTLFWWWSTVWVVGSFHCPRPPFHYSHSGHCLYWGGGSSPWDSSFDHVWSTQGVLSLFWTELFHLQGMSLKHNTAYHPQTDGQMKVVNRCIKTYLCCFALDKPQQWLRWLPWAEYWYNTSFHTLTETTPFRILYSCDPPPLNHFGTWVTKVASVEQELQSRDALLVEFKHHPTRAQEKMKAKADGKRRDVQFAAAALSAEVFDRSPERKTSPRYYGPYAVVARIGPVAYKLQLPDSVTVHPVFHVSQLRRICGVIEPSFHI